jgi:hypothetical protein
VWLDWVQLPQLPSLPHRLWLLACPGPWHTHAPNCSRAQLL